MKASAQYLVVFADPQRYCSFITVTGETVVSISLYLFLGVKTGEDHRKSKVGTEAETEVRIETRKELRIAEKDHHPVGHNSGR